MIMRGNEQIVIIRRTGSGVDEYGNPTYTTSRTTVRDCLFSVGTTAEPIDVERDAVDATLTLYFPEGTQILDGDLFELRGVTWQKNGSVQQWSSPVGLSVGPVVNVRRRVG